MLIYLIFSAFAAICYLLLQACYALVWEVLPAWEAHPDAPAPHTSISVMVVARNESAQIEACLQSLARQRYPAERFEIIVVNDHSEDDTAARVERFAAENPQIRLMLLHLADYPRYDAGLSPKKQAIEFAHRFSGGELTACTDADCVVPPDWLALLAGFYERERPVFIAAPVGFWREASDFERFQSLDFVGMMAITGAGMRLGTRLCNGANMAYPKQIFEAVGGYAGNERWASGDDVFLLQKIAQQYPDRVAFLKNRRAVVFTQAKPDLRGFVQQRLRWATKNRALGYSPITWALALAWGFHASMVADLLCAGLDVRLMLIFFAKFAVKALADSLLLRSATRFFQRPELMRWPIFLYSLVLHWLYIAGIGTAGLLVRRYTWKNRAQN